MWFSGFSSSHFVCHSWSVPMMTITGLIFLSGRTCTIGGWLNTFLPHCMDPVQCSDLVSIPFWHQTSCENNIIICILTWRFIILECLWTWWLFSLLHSISMVLVLGLTAWIILKQFRDYWNVTYSDKNAWKSRLSAWRNFHLAVSQSLPKFLKLV